jgi:hypothetical protein
MDALAQPTSSDLARLFGSLDRGPKTTLQWRRGVVASIAGYAWRPSDLARVFNRVCSEGDLVLMGALLRHAALQGGELLAQAVVEPQYPTAHSPLTRAVQNGHGRAVRWLLRRHADPNRVFGHPLTYAVTHGHAPVVRALLDAGANPDQLCGRPCACAVQQGRADLLWILLRRGADPARVSDRDLVWLACHQGSAQCCDLLRRHRVPVLHAAATLLCALMAPDPNVAASLLRGEQGNTIVRQMWREYHGPGRCHAGALLTPRRDSPPDLEDPLLREMLRRNQTHDALPAPVAWGGVGVANAAPLVRWFRQEAQRLWALWRCVLLWLARDWPAGVPVEVIAQHLDIVGRRWGARDLETWTGWLGGSTVLAQMCRHAFHSEWATATEWVGGGAT